MACFFPSIFPVYPPLCLSLSLSQKKTSLVTKPDFNFCKMYSYVLQQRPPERSQYRAPRNLVPSVSARFFITFEITCREMRRIYQQQPIAYSRRLIWQLKNKKNSFSFLLFYFLSKCKNLKNKKRNKSLWHNYSVQGGPHFLHCVF